MSITAFPVLSRILAERNMLQSPLGTLAIACAAVDDVTEWCILAYIVVLIRSSHGTNHIGLTLAAVIGFILAMTFGVRRLLRRFETIFNRYGAVSENLLALILVLVLVAALCTEWLGIHLLFGAFLMGTIMPKNQKFVRYIFARFEPLTVILLVPIFFAFTGLRTSIGLLKGPQMWGYCGVIAVLSCWLRPWANWAALCCPPEGLECH